MESELETDIREEEATPIIDPFYRAGGRPWKAHVVFGRSPKYHSNESWPKLSDGDLLIYTRCTGHGELLNRETRAWTKCHAIAFPSLHACEQGHFTFQSYKPLEYENQQVIHFVANSWYKVAERSLSHAIAWAWASLDLTSRRCGSIAITWPKSMRPPEWAKIVDSISGLWFNNFPSTIWAYLRRNGNYGWSEKEPQGDEWKFPIVHKLTMSDETLDYINDLMENIKVYK